LLICTTGVYFALVRHRLNVNLQVEMEQTKKESAKLDDDDDAYVAME